MPVFRLQVARWFVESRWPLDNALIALGLSRYGFKRQATQVLSALFDATLCFDQQVVR